MAFTNCSRWGQLHGQSCTPTESIDELKKKEHGRKVFCLGCFKAVKEYDVVKVISLNKSVPEAEVGDIGAVVMVYSPEAFEVECVLDTGSTKWLGTFARDKIKWQPTPNE